MNRDGPWIALDVGLARHRKVEGLGRAAPCFLYVVCLLHCGDELTDGYVREAAMPRLLLEAGARRDGRANDVQELERVGLLEPVHGGELYPLEDGGTLTVPGPGWVIPSYTKWNPTRAWWERQRAGAAERQRAKRERDRLGISGIQSESRTNPEPIGPTREREPDSRPNRSTVRDQQAMSRVTDTVTHVQVTRSDEKERKDLGTSKAKAPSRSTSPATIRDDLRAELERLQGEGGMPV